MLKLFTNFHENHFSNLWTGLSLIYRGNKQYFLAYSPGSTLQSIKELKKKLMSITACK